MDTTEIRIESAAEIMKNESPDDKRLNAIKKILVGNQIERIENRFRGLSRRVESTNSHLVSIVEELNQEMANLKSRSSTGDYSGPSNALSPEVGKLIQEFVDAKKEGKLAEDNYISNLESRLNQVELNIDTKAAGKADALKDEVSAFKEKVHASQNEFVSNVEGKANAIKKDVSAFKEKITENQNNFVSKFENRLGSIEEKVTESQNNFVSKLEDRLGSKEEKAGSKENKAVNNRLSTLETEIKSLRTKGNETFQKKVYDRQNEFENDVQELLERLTGRVNERFDYASDERNKLNNQVNGIQKVLEEDVVSFMRESIANTADLSERLQETEEKVNESVKSEQVKVLFENLSSKINLVESNLNNKIDSNPSNDAELKEISEDLKRKIYENNIRMEAKLDAMYDLTQRQLTNRKEDTSKKDALRETLKKLTQLLDE
jgi:hypothetical protein